MRWRVTKQRRSYGNRKCGSYNLATVPIIGRVKAILEEFAGESATAAALNRLLHVFPKVTTKFIRVRFVADQDERLGPDAAPGTLSQHTGHFSDAIPRSVCSGRAHEAKRTRTEVAI